MATPASKPNAPKKEAPKKDKGKPKAEVKKPKKEKVAVAEEKDASPQRGHAIVKSVLSGDALVLMGGGGVDGRVAPEKTVFLQGIVAPKFARSRRPDDKDQAWAWHSREFLRKKVIGQKVSFVVVSRTGPKKEEKEKDSEKADEKPEKADKGDKADKNAKAGAKGGKKEEKKQEKERTPRDYCIVKLDEINLSELVVRAGWAKVKLPQAREGRDGAPANIPADRQQLIALQEEAETQRIGQWANPESPAAIRTLEWNPDARAIFLKYKGVPLPAVVDFVRDGSTLRCELLGLDEYDLNHTMITLHLAGIQCPNTPIPGSADGKPAKKAEPFAYEAQQFTAARLLHRDVHVVIQGVDKFNNFFGTVNFAKGNITLKLLEHGLARVLSWSAAITTDATRIKQAERQAKEARLKIWANPTQEDEKEVHREVTGRVVQVISGDTLVIRTDEDAKEETFQLASIRVPRTAGARGDIGEPFGLEAREFVRKRLIGQSVNVLIEFYKERNSRDKKVEHRAHVSIHDGKGNVSQNLLSAGLASVSRHRFPEDRSVYYELYQKAEEQAIIEKKGMYANVHATVRPINDLTQRRVAAGDEQEQRGAGGARRPHRTQANPLAGKLKELRNDKSHRAIVEHVFPSGSRFKLFLPDKHFMLIFALAGVRVATQKDGEVAAAYGREAAEIAKTAILHHEVTVEFESNDQGGTFLGTLLVRGENLAVQFLQQGYAETLPAVDRATHAEDLLAAEAIAKQANLRLWSVKKEVVENKEDEDFKQETASVTVTTVSNGNTFYFQNAGDASFESVAARMAEFDSENAEAVTDFKPNLVCAGIYQADGQWHRVKIVGRTKDKGEQRVFFVDYGNTAIMAESDLKLLPEDLASIPGAARQGILLGCWSPAERNNKANNAKPNPSSRAAKATARFTELCQHPITAKIEAKQGSKYFVTLFTGEDPVININRELLETGFVKLADPKKSPASIAPLIAELAQFQDSAKTQQLGVWELGNPDDEEAEAGDRRTNGRQKGDK